VLVGSRLAGACGWKKAAGGWASRAVVLPAPWEREAGVRSVGIGVGNQGDAVPPGIRRPRPQPGVRPPVREEALVQGRQAGGVGEGGREAAGSTPGTG